MRRAVDGGADISSNRSRFVKVGNPNLNKNTRTPKIHTRIGLCGRAEKGGNPLKMLVKVGVEAFVCAGPLTGFWGPITAGASGPPCVVDYCQWDTQ